MFRNTIIAYRYHKPLDLINKIHFIFLVQGTPPWVGCTAPYGDNPRILLLRKT
jgi:hypothetical protein